MCTACARHQESVAPNFIDRDTFIQKINEEETDSDSSVIPSVSFKASIKQILFALRCGEGAYLPPPLRKHDVKKLRQAKVPWGSKKTAHG